MKLMRDATYKLELSNEESGGGKCFKLSNAICNHGFFMMPPNQWMPDAGMLRRPLRLADATTSVVIVISQPPNYDHLTVLIDEARYLTTLDLEAIENQIKRMLRISKKEETSLQNFHNVHQKAKEKMFGRLFRSPTLFEDAVKSLLLCNCTFLRTLKMATALCDLQAEIANGLKRKRGSYKSCVTETLGNFPTPQELASVELITLKEKCKLGHRAQNVLTLAQHVASGKMKIFENLGESGTTTQIYNRLLKIKGFGPFACTNVLMCLGFYHKIPQDSETNRVLQKLHSREIKKKDMVQVVDQLYKEYSPFQCLAYWFDLVSYYESKVGRLSDLSPSEYSAVSGSFLDVVDAKKSVAN